MAANHLKQPLFVEIAMQVAVVLNVNTEQGQVQVEMFSHPAQGSTASPDDHQVGFVLKQGVDVMGKSLDGVLFTDPFNLLFRALHETRRGGRPCLTVHSHLPLALGVHGLVEVHDFSDGRAKIAQCKREGHFSSGFWRGCKASGMHFDTAWDADERNGLGFRTRRFEGVNDVAGRAVPARIEDGVNPGFNQLSHQPGGVLR